MKKIYFSFIAILAGLSLNAQLTDANHSPAAGDMFSTWQCDSTAINPGASGSGALWNFSAIATRSSVVNNYTANANSNSSYPIPGVQLGSITNNLSYYKSTTSDLKYWGGNILVSGLAANLIYSAPAIVAAYPMSLNTSSTSATAGSISISALSQTGPFTGNSNTIADGQGTLVIPSGTYTNVYGVVTTQTLNFTVQLGSGSVTQKNFDYYTTTTKEALFSITTATIVAPLAGTQTQTVVTRKKPAVTTALTTNNAKVVDLQVYPNPSTANVNFETENADAKSVMIYDVTGNLIASQDFNEGKLKFDVSNFSTGLYLYSVIGLENKSLKSGKISVCH
jgi:hypothetical protein